MPTMEAEPVVSAQVMKEGDFCPYMLTELQFGKELEHVPLRINITATPHAIGNVPTVLAQRT